MKRFVAITLLTWPMLGLYMVIDHWQSLSPTKVAMPSWVPFCPAFAVPYSAMMFVWWLLPLAIRDAGRFRACLWALVCAYLVVMPWWIVTPTMLPRPALPPGFWAGYYQWLWTVDPPNNVMPCAHGIGPVVIAWFVARDRPTWTWPLAGMLLLGLPSIALTWQHRPIDIALGTLAALLGIALGEKLNRRNPAPVGDDVRSLPV